MTEYLHFLKTNWIRSRFFVTSVIVLCWCINQITPVQTGPSATMSTFNNSLQVVPGKVRCFIHGEAGAEIGLKVVAVEFETDFGTSSIFPILGSKDTSGC